MARSRNIKPGFFTNDVLGELPALTRLLFAGLWTICDRDGRVEDRPKKIRAEVLPYDQCDPEEMLQALHDVGFILRYEVAGRRLIQVLAWAEHQNPHVKEAASTLPAPGKSGASPVLAPVEESPLPERAGLIPDSGFLIPDSLNSDSVPDGTARKRVEGSSSAPFDAFWEAYPRKTGKDAARKAFDRRKVTREMLGEMLSAITAQRASEQWKKDGGQFIPHPSTWLNEGRWQDEEMPQAANVRRLVL